MRIGFAPVLLAAGLALTASPAGTAPKSSSPGLNYNSYVRLMNWARERGFERGTPPRENAVLLTNPNGMRLQVVVDSHEARPMASKFDSAFRSSRARVSRSSPNPTWIAPCDLCSRRRETRTTGKSRPSVSIPATVAKTPAIA